MGPSVDTKDPSHFDLKGFEILCCLVLELHPAKTHEGMIGQIEVLLNDAACFFYEGTFSEILHFWHDIPLL